MTTVSSTSSSAAGSQSEIFAALNAAGSSGGSSTASSTATDMESRFLSLLMAQIKNQDPLNPMDNAQMTSQLAQINTVNGIEKLNTTMSKLMSAYSDSQSMQSAAMIGKAVLVPGSAISLSSGFAAGGVKLDSAADQVTVKIMNSAGTVIQTETLGAKPAGSLSFTWDGKDSSGNAVADGTYKFSVEATKSGATVKSTPLELGTVNAVVRSGTGFILDLGALGQFDFDSVEQIL